MISSTHRFHGRNSLRFVYQHGRQVRGDILSLRAVRNAHQRTWRAAVVVSRKVSKSAVVRNRIRRRVFEVIRTQAGRIDGSYDLVVTVYSDSVATLVSAELGHMLDEQLQKASVVKASVPGVNHAIVVDKETV